MTPRRGTVRYYLQRIALLSLPHSVRPFNKSWKFQHYRHDAALRRLVQELRGIAYGLELRLDEIKEKAEEHSQP